MRLYHGSNILIDGINLAMCRPYSVNVQGATRSKPRDFSDFQRYPQSAYALYASIVCLVNR